MGHAPGAIDGHLTVSSDGAAVYSIALWVPPGRLGMQPDLSLEYYSRGGNGILGVGWRLGGLSRIHRCAHTLADDGVLAPIKFTVDDPFCLDGERLVLVSGNRGKADSVYTTLRDTVSKIVIDSDDVEGPISFTEYLKDGRIVRYGTTPDAVWENWRVSVNPPIPKPDQFYDPPNVVTQNQKVRYAWDISSIQDRYHNTISFHYQQTGAGALNWPGVGMYSVIQEIAYTGSPEGENNPMRHVRFFYTSRPETIHGYDAGFHRVLVDRLDRIEMWGPNPIKPALLRIYQFAYDTNTITGRSRLVELSEKDGNGVAKGSTLFQWENGTLDWDVVDTGINDFNQDSKFRWLQVLDINGDGKSDLLYVPEGSHDNAYAVRLSTGNNFGPLRSLGVPAPQSGRRPAVVDYDGNGKDDLLVYFDDYPTPGKTDAPCVFAATFLAGNPDLVSLRLVKCTDRSLARPADIDGDGLTDLVVYNKDDPSSWAYLLNSAAGYAAPVAFTGPHDNVQTLWLSNLPEIDAVDVDGAGADEILGTKDPQNDIRRTAYELGRGPLVPDQVVATTLPIGALLEFVDINGDGLPDAVAWSGGPDVRLNTGNGFSNAILINPGADYLAPRVDYDTGVRIFDYNSDGQQDMLVRGLTWTSDGYTQLDYLLVLQANGTAFTIENPSIQSRWHTNEDLALTQTLDVNGDGLDDIVVWDDTRLMLYIRRGKKPDMLTRITDGLGSSTSIRYEPISNPDVYTAGTSCIYPVTCLHSKLWVVAEVQDSDGTGGVVGRLWHYTDAREDRRGRGLLGMSQIQETNSVTGEVQTTHYDLGQKLLPSLYPLVGLPDLETTRTPLENGRFLERSVRRTYEVRRDVSTNVFSAIATTVVERETEIEPDGAQMLLRQITTTQKFDSYLNLTDQQRTTGDGDAYQYHADYTNSPSEWLMQQLTHQVETSITPKGQRTTRTIAYTYDAAGWVRQVIVEPGVFSGGTWQPRVLGPNDDGVQTLYRTYDRGPSGLVDRIISDVTPTGSPHARYMYIQYGPPDQVFFESELNQLGHGQRFGYHSGLGVLAVAADENGIRSQWQYDGFGRVRRDAPGGADGVTFHYGFTPGTPYVQVQEAADSGATSAVDTDERGREIRRVVTSRSDGVPVTVETQYDPLDRGVRAVSLPHFATVSPVFQTYDYDNLGRLRFVHAPDGSTTEWHYDGLWTTHVDPRLLTHRALEDQLHRIVLTEDIIPASINQSSHTVRVRYQYGPFDVLSAVQDSQKNVFRAEYDRLGRRIGLRDPDSGHSVTVYNAFGEVLTETVAVGTPQQETITYNRDPLGRPHTVVSASGASFFDWDNSPKGIGKLARSRSPDGVVIDYSYDNFGRPSSRTWSVLGQQFTIVQELDPQGRLMTLTYPKISGHAPLALQYNYAAQGDLVSIVDRNTATVYWSRLSTDETGQPTDPSGRFKHEAFGNGVVTRRRESSSRPGQLARIETASTNTPIEALNYDFDADGNLIHRVDAINVTDETFDYDGLNRLEQWVWTTNSKQRHVLFKYDDLNNLRQRSVVEDPASVVNQVYQQPGPAGPHAVTLRNGRPYRYDARGNQIQGPDRSIRFTWFNLPSVISTSSQLWRFSYDATGERALEQSNAGFLSITLGHLYEKRTVNGQTRHILTIHGPDRPVAEVVWTENGVGFDPDQIEYLHADHEGSIDLITDGNANASHYKYEPFGNEVSPTDFEVPASPSPIVRAGFTGQDYDDQLGLINMNGRVYDPTQAHFLTPDPIISTPFYPPAYNRYAYALNNPTTFVDPSGLVDERSSSDYGLTLPVWSSSAPSLLRFSPEITRELMLRQPPRSALHQELHDFINGPGVDVPGINTPGWFEQLGFTKFAQVLRMGYPCVACHLITELGRIPEDEELDLDAVRAWGNRALVVRALVEFGTTVGLARANWSLRSITAYRVQGGISEQRIVVGPNGKPVITGNTALYINVGDKARALEWLVKRGRSAYVMSFELDSAFVEELREFGVQQGPGVGKLFPGRPQIVDFTKALDQYGLPSTWFGKLLDAIIPGTTKILRPK